jgi:hypothetical protein
MKNTVFNYTKNQTSKSSPLMNQIMEKEVDLRNIKWTKINIKPMKKVEKKVTEVDLVSRLALINIVKYSVASLSLKSKENALWRYWISE